MLRWLFVWLLLTICGQKTTIWPILVSFEAFKEVWKFPSFFHASADDDVAFFRHCRSFCFIICKFCICVVRYCIFSADYVSVLLIMGIFGINYLHILHISSTIWHLFCILWQNLLIMARFFCKLPAYSVHSSAWGIIFSWKCRVRMPSPGLQD